MAWTMSSNSSSMVVPGRDIPWEPVNQVSTKSLVSSKIFAVSWVTCLALQYTVPLLTFTVYWLTCVAVLLLIKD